jgi:hypothetical protein
MMRRTYKVVLRTYDGGGIVSLPIKERDKALRHVGSQAAATAARHVFIAAARKIRCVQADARCRWTLKVL